MGAETMEQASTGRSKCVICKEPIPKDAWRMKVTAQSDQYDGEVASMHHAICAAMRRPTPFLRALKKAGGKKMPKAAAEVLKAIATSTSKKKLKDVVWRHATEPRCVLEFAGPTFVLHTFARGKAVTVEGTLDEVVQSVPDEDLEEVVDTAQASGKALGKAAKAPAAAPAAPLAPLRQRYKFAQGTAKYEQDIAFDPAKRKVTIDAGSKNPQVQTFATAELAAKYFRFVLASRGAKYVSGDKVALDPAEDYKDVKDKTSDYRYLEHAATKQFWDIDRDYAMLTICAGAIGTNGTQTFEELDWDGDAKRRYKELLAAQIAAGYAEPKGFASRRATGKKR